MNALESTSIDHFLSNGVFPMLFDWLLRGSVLLTFAALAVFVLRRNSAAMRHAIWVVALGAVVAIPAFSTILPAWRVLPTWLDVAISSQARPTVASARTPQAVNAVDHNEYAERDENVSVAPLQFAYTPGSESRRRSTVWATLWLTGLATLILRMVLSHFALCRLKLVSCDVTEGSMFTLHQELCRQLGLRHRVRLLQGDRRSMPMAWGLIQACVFVPGDAANWSPDRLRAVLLHELAHIRRRDPLTHILVQVTCALHWFNPCVWIAAWRVTVERERACDDLVLRSGVNPFDYAEHLLRVASGHHERWIAGGSAVAMAHRSRLEGRVRWLVDGSADRRGLSRRSLAIAAVASAAIVAPVAMMQAGNPQPPDRDDRLHDSNESHIDVSDEASHQWSRMTSFANLTALEVEALLDLQQQGHFDGWDSEVMQPVNPDDTLPDLSRVAGMTDKERQAIERLAANKRFTDFERLIAYQLSDEASPVEQIAILKLQALWKRQLSNLRQIDQWLTRDDLGTIQRDAIEKIRRLVARQQAPSILSVREILQPQEGARSSWTALVRRQLGDEPSIPMALVRAAMNSPIPVRLQGSEETLFTVRIDGGNDEQLDASIMVPNSDQPLRLKLVRDEPAEFNLGGKTYRLSYGSTWVARSSSRRHVPTAHLFITQHPVKTALPRKPSGKSSTPADRDGNRAGPDNRSVELRVLANGQVFAGSKRIEDLAEFARRSDRENAQHSPPVLLRVSPQARHRRVVEILDQLAELGLDQVTLATTADLDPVSPAASPVPR